jgi:hypothetical protein
MSERGEEKRKRVEGMDGRSIPRDREAVTNAKITVAMETWSVAI